MQTKIFLLLFFSSILPAQTIYIIANKNFPQKSLTKKEIKAIYLDKKHYIKGKKLLPLNLSHDNPLRREFEKNILQKSRSYLQKYWLKAHYKGHRPPKVLKSKASVISFVKKLENTIGYVDINISNIKEIKILYKAKLP